MENKRKHKNKSSRNATSKKKAKNEERYEKEGAEREDVCESTPQSNATSESDSSATLTPAATPTLTPTPPVMQSELPPTPLIAETSIDGTPDAPVATPVISSPPSESSGDKDNTESTAQSENTYQQTGVIRFEDHGGGCSPDPTMDDDETSDETPQTQPKDPPTNVPSNRTYNVSSSWGYITNKGCRNENQDSYLVPDPSTTRDREPLIFGVFDGHGIKGGEAAREAGRLVGTYLRKSATTTTATSQEKDDDQKCHAVDPQQVLEEAFQHAQEVLLGHGSHRRGVLDYGTTACVAMVYQQTPVPHAVVGWVGDTRAVVCRRHPDTHAMEAVFLTEDHVPTLAPEKARIEASRGKVVYVWGVPRVIPAQDYTEPQIKEHRLALNISRALGHVILSQYGVSPVPDIRNVSLLPGDLLVLASDGLWNEVRADEVARLIGGEGGVQEYVNIDPQRICTMLLREVEKRCKVKGVRGPPDNITIVAYQQSYTL